MATATTPPPGGPEANEPATDICAIFLGFGVFTANAAFDFKGFTEGFKFGWKSSRLGYLNEPEIAYALAIFMSLKELPYRLARKHLKLNPRCSELSVKNQSVGDKSYHLHGPGAPPTNQDLNREYPPEKFGPRKNPSLGRLVIAVP